MAESIAVVVPVFVLIALGFAFGKSGRFNPGTAKGLTDFTFTLAVPAMLFRTVSTAEFPGLTALSVWLAFFGALLIGWLITAFLVKYVLRRPGPDGASISVSAAYGNVVMLGIPLCYNVYGPAAGATIAILLSIHTPLLWLGGSLHMALVSGEGDGRTLRQTAVDIFKELARNPIVIAVVLGFSWQMTGLGLHPLVDRTLNLLGQAGIPCSLVALGLSLVAFEIKGQTTTLLTIMIVKLIVIPAAAAVLAYEVFALDAVTAGVVVLFAAMPSGANAFLFANRYQRAVNSASGSVALGTALAAPVTAVIVYILKS